MYKVEITSSSELRFEKTKSFLSYFDFRNTVDFIKQVNTFQERTAQFEKNRVLEMPKSESYH